MTASDDAPLRTLLLPFETGAVAWPEAQAGRVVRGGVHAGEAGAGVLFLHARDGAPLHQRPLPGLRVEQAFKPALDALHAAGFAVDADPAQRHPLVLLLPPRQREQARALLALAFDRCSEGGRVVACVANDAGARSAEADLRALAGLEGSLSKHHCRVFWARNDAGALDPERLARWRGLDAPRRIDAPRLPGGGFLSRPGVFAWDRIDPASALLAAHLPQDLGGDAADLGAGWGYLSIELLRRSPRIRALDLYEADARALQLARENLAASRAAAADDAVPARAAALDFLWHDVAAGLPRRYDVIVTNPPFHAQDRVDRPELGQRFIAAAAQALRPGGRLFLVANRHLPYEAALSSGFAEVRVLAVHQGFKAIEARR